MLLSNYDKTYSQLFVNKVFEILQEKILLFGWIKYPIEHIDWVVSFLVNYFNYKSDEQDMAKEEEKEEEECFDHFGQIAFLSNNLCMNL